MDSITIAKFLSVPTAFIVSGFSFAASQSSVPLVYNQPAAYSSVFLKGIYLRGAAVVAPAGLTAAAAFGYLAYKSPDRRAQYGTSAGLVLGPMIFTQLVMSGGINRLLEISSSAIEQQKAEQTGEVLKLLKAWVAQNYVRAAMSFSAGMIGLWTSGNF